MYMCKNNNKINKRNNIIIYNIIVSILVLILSFIVGMCIAYSTATREIDSAEIPIYKLLERDIIRVNE